MTKLNTLEIVKESHLAVWQHKFAFLRLSWVWIALFVSVITVGLTVFPVGDRLSSMHLVLLLVIFYGVFWLAIASISVGWHKTVLQISAPQSFFYFNMERQVWRYMGALFLFGFLGSFVFFPVMFFFNMLAIQEPKDLLEIGSLLYGGLWLASGLNLLLPALALGHNTVSFQTLVGLGKGQRLRLFFIQFVPFLLFVCLALLLLPLLADSYQKGVLGGIGILALYFWLAYLSSLSLMYKALNSALFKKEAA